MFTSRTVATYYSKTKTIALRKVGPAITYLILNEPSGFKNVGALAKCSSIFFITFRFRDQKSRDTTTQRKKLNLPINLVRQRILRHALKNEPIRGNQSSDKIANFEM